MTFLQPALGSIQWVRCLELQRDRGVPHIHGLVAQLDDTRFSGASSYLWTRFGLNRILEYNPKLGAAYYLTKYVVKEFGDIAFSPGLRPH